MRYEIEIEKLNKNHVKEGKITPIAIVLLIIGLVLGAFIGYALQSSVVSSLQAQVSSLQSYSENLFTQIASLRNNNTALQGQIVSLQSNKAGLQSQITSLQNDKVKLEAQVSNLQNEITNLTSQKTRIITVNEIRQDILGVYFSPSGGCASEVMYWIGRANSSIHILIYSFTLDDVGDAVLSSYQKGVDIKIVFEKSQNSKYSEYFRLTSEGVQTRNDTNPEDMHDKVAIIDGHIVLTGSFNWSNNAEEHNDENLIIIDNAQLAATYEQVFDRIWTTGR